MPGEIARRSRYRADRPSLKREGKPIELTDYAPFNSNVGQRRKIIEHVPWKCVHCGTDNPRYRNQCHHCGARRNGELPR